MMASAPVTPACNCERTTSDSTAADGPLSRSLSAMSAPAAKRTASAAAQACMLLGLPDELLHKVLEFLDLASLQSAGATSGRLQRAAADEVLVEAAVRSSGVFWARLAYDEDARSPIEKLVPQGLAARRLYFSGTRAAAAPVCGAPLFLYGTLDTDDDIVATFGPVDTNNVVGSGHSDSWKVKMDIDWKSPLVFEEYAVLPDRQTLKKTVTAKLYALTVEGAYLICRNVGMKGGSNRKIRACFKINSCTEKGFSLHGEISHLFRPTSREFVVEDW